jgi:transcriptional regulator with XRE-family HTH domain
MLHYATQAYYVAICSIPQSAALLVSYFANKLTELMRGKRQQDVADSSGIARSTISLYASNERNIDVAMLEKLLNAFPDRKDQSDLIHAHLLDEVPGTHFDNVKIEVGGIAGTVNEEPASFGVSADKEVDASLAWLRRAAARDDDVRRVIVDLAKVVR